MLYKTGNPHGGDVYQRKIDLDYSANTNPYGTPEGVKAAIREAAEHADRYPDPYCRELVKAISAHEGVPEDFVLCGNGAADLIYAFCRALKPALAAELAPTFSEYSLGLEGTGCRTERFFLREEEGFAVTGELIRFLEEKKPEVLFLCNPNNPTGRLMDPELLERTLLHCRANGIRVLLDECFIDLTEGRSMKDLLPEHPELLILRAFTKSYGMAGVRLGYCLCADGGLLGRMAAASQPWNVSSLAQAAGAAALKEEGFLKKTKETVAAEREWLTQRLGGCGMKVVPSDANYLLFRGPLDLGKRLEEKGIAVRDCGNYHGLEKGWYRVAVRLRDQNERLMEAVREAVKEGRDG